MSALAEARRPHGMAAFFMIWSSQIFSILASMMTGFALTIWMFERTQSATAMALVQTCFVVPFMAMSFFSGPMVDRYNRKLMMAVSDICSAVATGSIMLCNFFGYMEPWMLYVGAAILGLGASFQWPAFSATISLIVPKEHLGRVNGLMGILEAGPAIFAPILAGALLPFIGLAGVMAIDVATFIVAISTLLFVDIPNPERTAEGEKAKGNLVTEALWGFRYIFERPSLLGLQLLLLAGNTFSGFGATVLAPMLLAKTGTDTLLFGSVQSVAAIGGLVGGVVLSVWGGFKRRTLGIALGWFLCGLFGGVLFGFANSFWVWAIALAFTSMASPLINSSNQSLWMAKVAPDMQGRVFSARRMIAQISGPLVPMIAGPLADYVFEPAMRNPGSSMASALGPLFGTGPGAGMAVMMVLSGLLVMAIGCAGWAIPAIRNAEKLLPDFAKSKAEMDAEGSAEAATEAVEEGGRASAAEGEDALAEIAAS